MKRLRWSIFLALVSGIAMWSVAATTSDPARAVSSCLVLLFLGAVPCLAVGLCWKTPRPDWSNLVRYGQNRRVPRLVLLAKDSLQLCAVTAVLALFTQAALWGFGSAKFVKDALSTLPVAIAAGASFSSYFACARAWFGKFGLVLSLILFWSGMQTTIKWALPSAYVRHLLAVGLPLSTPGGPLSGYVALTLLWALALSLGALTLLKTPR